MSYKVSYYTLPILPNGETGNIPQGSGHCFTDTKIEDIPATLNARLASTKRVAVIQKIEDVKGFVL